MTKLVIEKDVVIKRVAGVEAEIAELEKLRALALDEFSTGDGWKLAQFHLHRALEGVFNISSHILSRIPGMTATQYKEIAQKLGEAKIIPLEFAQTKLVEMAKYRNRLVHFYAQIEAKELYEILQNDLGDFEIFLKEIKKVLQNPGSYGLSVE
jgi:uncharacterized protein YutE (UPF0331/DUF86 family)